ncbi:MAG TPA: hypothetical protein VHY21_05475 [Pseudonocardiaceae bacterium]|nr:hypothetical protein [Pseudonocardiaceae bacterium]
MLGRGGDGSVAREFAGQVVGAEQRGVGDGDPDVDSATAPAAPAITSAAGSPGAAARWTWSPPLVEPRSPMVLAVLWAPSGSSVAHSWVALVCWLPVA